MDGQLSILGKLVERSNNKTKGQRTEKSMGATHVILPIAQLGQTQKHKHTTYKNERIIAHYR